jgi:hypothetical protein
LLLQHAESRRVIPRNPQCGQPGDLFNADSIRRIKPFSLGAHLCGQRATCHLGSVFSVSVTSLPAIDDLPVTSHGNTLYAGSSTIAGPILPASDRVRYKEILSGGQRLALGLLVGLNVVASAALLGWLLWPSHFPLPRASPMFLVEILGLGLMVAIEAIRVLQTSALWIFAGRARDPIPTRPAPSGWRYSRRSCPARNRSTS